MEITIRIAGAAGQGIQTTADLLGKAVTRSGLYASCYTDAESRIRGGLNFSQLRIATSLKMGVSKRYDILVAMTDLAVEKFADKIPETGALISYNTTSHQRSSPFSISELAKQAGNPKAAGTVAFAVLCALIGIDQDLALQLVSQRFAAKPELAEINTNAVNLGYQAGRSWAPAHQNQKKDSKAMWLAGNEALSLGAVAGGVRFVSGYPMSPATSILVNLAKWAKKANIIVEQAEDEIAAINMLAGASYAGARSLTATSGGGFCLMTEGVSLLGMIEAPAVIIIGQRPGPATGLPTRTAQGDLHLVLHSGHGFFPRVVLAPKNIEDCFEIGARAFDIAEKYQVPVFILTDQLLQDSQASIESLDVSKLSYQDYYLAPDQLNTMETYKRYALTDTGISPMAAPGVSKHTVVVDSDEHDQEGHLTESAEIATQMVEKRLRKAKSLQEAELLATPKIEGQLSGRPLVISWGSTYETLAEARSLLDAAGIKIAHLHLRQLWPLNTSYLKKQLADASQVIVVENNVSQELTNLLRKTTLLEIDHVINRFDGRPFNVDQLVSRLKEIVA
jgi:2-oxoglutarate ferredoxin oxidoreductase subunit alpha